MFKGWIRSSLIDYPDRIATVLFTGGCDFRCPMCHNASLVLKPGELPDINEDQIWEFLAHRKGLIDGIVLTGGEPTLHSGLVPFSRQAQDRGMKIKLDTSGYHPEVLTELLDEGLVDYIAMDVKGPPEKYALLSGLEDINLERIEQSMSLIRKSGIAYEFRTTVVPGMLDEGDIEVVACWIKGAMRYVLQQFRPLNTLDPALQNVSPYPVKVLDKMAEKVASWVKEVEVRGV